MKVLMVVQHLRQKGERGGQRSREVFEKLISEGFQVDAVVPNIDPLTSKVAIDKLLYPWRIYRSDSLGNKEFRYFVPPVARKGIWGRMLYSIFSFINIALFLTIRRNNYHLILTTTHPLLMSVASIYGKKIYGAKLVVEVRDIPLYVAIERKVLSEKSLITSLYRKIEAYLFSKSDLVLGYSNRMIKLLEAAYSVPESLILPIGSDNSLKHKEYEFLSKKNNEVKICFFGTLGTVLRLNEAFDLVTYINKQGIHCSLDIYGDGERRIQLEKLVKQKYKNIYFKGVVSKSDVIEICSGYDFSYYPVEGGKAVSASLGNKFFDYLSARTPMIVYGRDSEIADIVTKYNIGFVGDSVQEIGERLAHFKKSFINSECLNSNFDNALSRFSKPEILNELVSNLSKLVNDGENYK